MMLTLDSRFAAHISANIEYWLHHVQSLDEQQLGLLDVDWPNVLRAVQFGLLLEETRVATIELALELFHFVEKWGYWRVWMPVLRRLISKCSDDQQYLRGRVLYQIGNLLRLDRRLTEAIEAHQTAETIMYHLGDTSQANLVRYAIAEDFRHDRQYDVAERWALMAYQGLQKQATEPTKTLGSVLNTLGLIAYARGDLVLAQEELSKAVTALRTEGSPTELARMLNNLAIVLQSAGNYEAAIGAYTEAGELVALTNSGFDKIMIELSLGTLYFENGRLTEAEAAFQRANVPFLKQSGHVYYRALAANNLGNVFLAQGRLEEAVTYLQEGIMLWRQAKDSLSLANTLGTLAEAFVAQGESSLAIAPYEEAFTLLQNHQDDDWGRRLLAKFTSQRQQLSEVS